MGIYKDSFELGLFMTGLLWRPVPSRSEYARFRELVEALIQRLGLPSNSLARIFGKAQPRNLVSLLLQIDDKTKIVNDIVCFPLKHMHGEIAYGCFQLGRHLANIAGSFPLLSNMEPTPTPQEMRGYMRNLTNSLRRASATVGTSRLTETFTSRIEEVMKKHLTKEQLNGLAGEAMDLAGALSLWIDSNTGVGKHSKPRLVIRGLLKGIPWFGPAIDALVFGKE